MVPAWCHTPLMPDIFALTLSQLATAYRTGELSAVQVTQAYLDRFRGRPYLPPYHPRTSVDAG